LTVSDVLADRRVLLVEDEMMVSMMLEDMLVELGCTVLGPVSDLKGALALAREAELDVAVLDVNLDGDATYPVADALAARGVPYVFATGYGSDGLVEAYRLVPTLEKPFQQRELASALIEALQPV
jgi:CheY-like chemotaxis protein